MLSMTILQPNRDFNYSCVVTVCLNVTLYYCKLMDVIFTFLLPLLHEVLLCYCHTEENKNVFGSGLNRNFLTSVCFFDVVVLKMHSGNRLYGIFSKGILLSSNLYYYHFLICCSMCHSYVATAVVVYVVIWYQYILIDTCDAETQHKLEKQGLLRTAIIAMHTNHTLLNVLLSYYNHINIIFITIIENNFSILIHLKLLFYTTHKQLNASNTCITIITLIVIISFVYLITKHVT